jgi:hypothetical protein
VGADPPPELGMEGLVRSRMPIPLGKTVVDRQINHVSRGAGSVATPCYNLHRPVSCPRGDWRRRGPG